jgi:peptidoglycan/LPS O-acetylase OafA/YrhL
MSDSRFARFERLFAVQATDKEMRRRGQLLSMVLLSVMLLGALLRFVYVAGWLTTGSAEYLIYLANDLFALIMLAALFYINRRGWVKAAAFGFSLLLIAIIIRLFH